MLLEHTELRKRLISIRDDPNITPAAKPKLSQHLLCSRKPIPSRLLVANCSLSCEHYEKQCSRFVFECCGTVDPCHRCHLARGTCDMKPPAISSVVCNKCSTQQAPSASCVACAAPFSHSYCSKCKIWTDKEITHCDHCGFCRVGTDAGLFHCFTCEACFHNKDGQEHRCAKSKFKDCICPLCLDSVYTAQKESSILPCGHVLHSDCRREAVRKGEYRCPTCRKALLDMTPIWAAIRSSIQQQPLPKDLFPLASGDRVASPFGDFLLVAPQGSSGIWDGYLVDWPMANGQQSRASLHASVLHKTRRVAVLCYDCEAKSTADFHFLGLECGACGGFNTRQG